MDRKVARQVIKVRVILQAQRSWAQKPLGLRPVGAIPQSQEVSPHGRQAQAQLLNQGAAGRSSVDPDGNGDAGMDAMPAAVPVDRTLVDAHGDGKRMDAERAEDITHLKGIQATGNQEVPKVQNQLKSIKAELNESCDQRAEAHPGGQLGQERRHITIQVAQQLDEPFGSSGDRIGLRHERSLSADWNSEPRTASGSGLPSHLPPHAQEAGHGPKVGYMAHGHVSLHGEFFR